MHSTFRNQQGMALHVAHWPVEQPRAVIALVHGQGEHIGRYEHVARWYNRQGFAFIGFDQQGYGRSEGKRGHADNTEVLLHDIHQFVELAKAQYPGLPFFLYGHSMGGGLSLAYLIQYKPELTGAIIGSPWIQLAFQPPKLKVVGGRWLRKILPTLTLPNGLAVHFISRDHATVEAYKADPLGHNKLSAAAGIALLETFNAVHEWSGEFPFPILLMHGEADKITSHAATRAFAERLQGDVTFKLWPGLYHELHNEPERTQIFEFTLAWCTAKLIAQPV